MLTAKAYKALEENKNTRFEKKKRPNMMEFFCKMNNERRQTWIRKTLNKRKIVHRI